jgi:hypothetical protein
MYLLISARRVRKDARAGNDEHSRQNYFWVHGMRVWFRAGSSVRRMPVS